MRWIFALFIVTAAEAHDFDACVSEAVGAFERALPRSTPENPDIRMLSQRDILICGGAGIQFCDLQEDRISCQAELTVQQDLLTTEVLESLPSPDAIDAPETQWSEGLYPVLHALANGSSAGPDCAGNGDLMAAWCEAVEANRRLATAVMAWQLARLLDATAPAEWVVEAAPPAPQPRPER